MPCWCHFTIIKSVLDITGITNVKTRFSNIAYHRQQTRSLDIRTIRWLTQHHAMTLASILWTQYPDNLTKILVPMPYFLPPTQLLLPFPVPPPFPSTPIRSMHSALHYSISPQKKNQPLITIAQSILDRVCLATFPTSLSPQTSHTSSLPLPVAMPTCISITLVQNSPQVTHFCRHAVPARHLQEAIRTIQHTVLVTSQLKLCFDHQLLSVRSM